MESQLVELDLADWNAATPNQAWIAALEAGKVLVFPRLGFELLETERSLLTPALLAPKVRNISLDAQGRIKGVAGDSAVQRAAAAMVGRFRAQAQQLVHGLLPHYTPALRLAPTSYRPAQVETRVQSWRADDKRMHIDAFPSRPNYGERILRVFANVNPDGAPRVWRVGEPFEDVARRFLPRAKPYSSWQAKLLRAVRVTKSLRSEYDHLMLQLHDGMKSDLAYQEEAPQQTVPFPAGAVWVCFSDQTSHAVMAGQYMLEQTLHLPAARQYNPESSPLAILSRLTGRSSSDPSPPHAPPNGSVRRFRFLENKNMATIPITKRGAEKLREELHRLKTVDRPWVINAISEARAQGDLSENAEYEVAKDRQGFIEGRIQEVEGKLSQAQIIDPSELDAGGKIVFGTTVELEEESTGEAVKYQIVGEDEADLKLGLINISSPIARALIGKEEGDTAEVQAPGGIKHYEIVGVSYV